MNQKKAKQRQAYDYLYYVIRAAVLLSVVFLFIPSLNPARISGMINKNLSLFTSGISYGTLTNGFGRAFKKGWVSESSFVLDCAGAIVMCVGIASGVAAACMSLGNIRLKKLGNIFSLISGVTNGFPADAGAIVMCVGISASVCSRKYLKKFIPSLNPARISGMINKNLSLFTSGISYSTLTNGFGRAFKKGWVSQESFMLDCAGAIVMCVGIASGVAAACMSLGNIRLKKLGNIFSLISGVVMTAGIVMISTAYKQISASEKVDKIEPMLPKSVTIMTVFAVILIISSIASILLLKKQKSEKKFEMETKYTLFLMLMPFLALVAVFSYLPLWGWRYAFFDYKAGDSLSMANFVGFKWFTELLKNPATVKDIGNVMKNTLGMSGIGILTSWMPMAFAIFLCEIKNLKFRRFVQTFTTVPNFISWVLVYSIATCIFSTDGFLSSILVNLGIWSEGHNLLMNGSHTWLKMWLWGTWKGIGSVGVPLFT